MAVETPAVADTTVDATDASLLDDDGATNNAPPAESGTPKETTTKSKPADDKKAGKDGAKEEGDKSDASLLADDDDGNSPDKADGQADDKKDAAPETYEAFTLPDGMELDDTALAQAMPVFKELNLSQDNAQKLVSIYAELAAKTSEGIRTQQVADHTKLVSEWTKATKAHPEFGGDKLPESRALVKKAIVALSDSPKEAAELTSMLNEWKLANNPLLFSLLARAGSKLSEDSLVTADAAAQSAPKSAAEHLWPSMFKTQE